MVRNGPDKGWSDAGMAVRVTVRSRWIEQGNLNGTKDITHASNTRHPSTPISKPIIDPENCPPLRAAHQHRRRLSPPSGNCRHPLASARGLERAATDGALDGRASPEQGALPGPARLASSSSRTPSQIRHAATAVGRVSGSASGRLQLYYATVVIPASLKKPRDKAKVETGVQIAQRQILAALRDQRFFSVAEPTAKSNKWYNGR